MSRIPKKFDMKMAINFDNINTELETSIRVLGLQVDSKLRWGPHIAQFNAKSINQCRAIKCLSKDQGSGVQIGNLPLKIRNPSYSIRL